jgi:hypothetical protein
MRVAYLDLGLSREQYGIQPTRYGGGAVAARHLKEDPEVEFIIFAPPEAFDNVGPMERRDRCVALPKAICDAIQRGFSFPSILKDHFAPFDLILHPHTCFSPARWNYQGPIVHWSGFDGKAGHPANDYILLYDPSFAPCFGERAKYVRIGKPVPERCPERGVSDRPYLFQCSRHDDHMGSVTLAKACRAAGIPAVFAGPIHPGCKLMDEVDGSLIQYIGEISEEEKLRYCREARLFSILYDWDPPFSQSLIEAQGQGTPIYVPNRGPFLPTYLHHGVNGFDASLMSLTDAWAAAGSLNPQDCWAAAKAYDVPVMVESFKRAFREIVAEWAG